MSGRGAKLFRPIVVLGTGRCGTTLLHRLLSRHPRLAWLSHVCTRFPFRPGLNALAMRLLDVPVLGGLVRGRLDPAEAWPLWERLAPGFSEPPRDLTEDDLREEDRARIVEQMSRQLTPCRDRLLLKITGWPRMRYLDAVFGEPYYIHILRDGRAVAASTITVPWWRGREGPDDWRWGTLDPELEERWIEHDRSAAVLAGLQWELLMRAIEKAAAAIDDDRYTEVRYEALCREPIRQVRRLVSAAGLAWSESFARSIGSVTIRNRNHLWKERIDERDRRRLESALRPAFLRYGYL